MLRMRISIPLSIIAPLCFLATGLDARQQDTVASGTLAPSSVVETIENYCVRCHNTNLLTAGLALDEVARVPVADHITAWEKVVRKLSFGEMPPAGMPRPGEATTAGVISVLEAMLDAEAHEHPHPGYVTAHRINRTEYGNAIRDLFDLEVDVRELLPPDAADQGFDNIAGALSLSPALLQRYMSAASRISRLAVGDPTVGIGFGSKTYSVPKMLFQDDRIGDQLPLGSRGGISVRHIFPLDGEYRSKIRLRRTMYGYIRDFDEPHRLEIRLDGQLVRAFTVGGAQRGAPAPVSFSGNIPGDESWEDYMLNGDANLEARFHARAGARLLSVHFLRTVFEPDGIRQPILPAFGFSINESVSSPYGSSGPAVDSVSVEGPFSPTGVGETDSRKRVFVCNPDSIASEQPCARRIIENVMRRAFRRPVTESDVDGLFEFYQAGYMAGGFDAGIQAVIERLLVDPEFLFRIESAPTGVSAGTVYKLSDIELASRLSFFLWSSIPDEELLSLGEDDRLHEPETLGEQIGRMLSDERAEALVEVFATQWLSLRNLRSIAPDPVAFPTFDENLREAFENETRLFIASQLREDRPLIELITAEYTFLNERLARHYGIPGVYGSHFRRVALRDEMHRGGLLGQGSILTVTAYPTRTSPVVRGKWLLENILGSPPPPPPADIPPFPDNEEAAPKSVRERMEQHRRNPVCAVCHVQMDPLGFSLEHFDAIGKWRSLDEAGYIIDAAGQFPDGTQFDGIDGLRVAISGREHQFVRTAVEKLLTYALGRGLVSSDMAAVREIMRQSASSGYRWSSIIRGVVDSVPFRLQEVES